MPYSAEVRPDTGFANGTLGMWLFLASEAMLFGALFSGYVLLRTGTVGWPHGAERLGLTLASINTVILAASSATMLLAARAAAQQRIRRARWLLAATAGLGVGFLAIKLSEWAGHLAAGERPASDTFFAVYYTLTGVHLLHVIGGVAVLAYLAVWGGASRPAPRFASRVSLLGMYWQFVDVVWIVLFLTVYVW